MIIASNAAAAAVAAQSSLVSFNDPNFLIALTVTVIFVLIVGAAALYWRDRPENHPRCSAKGGGGGTAISLSEGAYAIAKGGRGGRVGVNDGRGEDGECVIVRRINIPSGTKTVTIRISGCGGGKES